MVNKSIYIFTTAHPTDDIRVYDKFCKTFIDEGFRVSWIGPDFNFFNKENIKISNVNWYLFENSTGIKGRIKNIRNAYQSLKNITNVDYIYCPDPDAAFLAVNFRPNKNTKVIFDIHEVYHKGLLKRKLLGLNFMFISYFIQKLITKVCLKSDLVLGVSKKVLGYYSFDINKSLVVRSCAPISIVQDLSTINMDITKNICYTIVHGKNHMSRGTGVIIKSISLLKEKYKENIFKVLMVDLYDVLEGNHENPYSKEVNKYDVAEFLDLRNGMSLKNMQIELAKSHAGLISYGKDLGVDSLPNRLFEFMAAGLPVIVPEYATEIVDIVISEKCGIITDMENPYKIAESIQYFIDNKDIVGQMGQNGKEAFYKRHNWEHEISPVINYIKNNYD